MNAELDSSNPLSTHVKMSIKYFEQTAKRLDVFNSILQRENEEQKVVLSNTKRNLRDKRKMIDDKHVMTSGRDSGSGTDDESKKEEEEGYNAITTQVNGEKEIK